jgi:hypothetical protein
MKNIKKSKTVARNEIDKDMHLIKWNTNKGLYFYDLQADLLIPSGEVSSFYYKRRLATYKFYLQYSLHTLTVCDSNNNKGHHFICNESVGNNNRRAIEIGSWLLKFVENFVPNERTELLFYSDNCNGQNKNKYIYTLYIYIVMYTNNISEIIH